MIYQAKIFQMFEIAGRGRVITVDTRDHYWAPLVKNGDILRADGEYWEVRGIEKSWKLMSPPLLGDVIGFIVRNTDPPPNYSLARFDQEE